MKRRNQKTRKLKDRQLELIESAKYSQRLKETVVEYHAQLEQAYKLGKISYPEYKRKYSQVLEGKNLREWTNYYDKCIRYYKQEYSKIDRELNPHPVNSQNLVIPILIVGILLVSMLGVGIFAGTTILEENSIFGDSISGFAVDDSIANTTIRANFTQEEIDAGGNESVFEEITAIIPIEDNIKENIEEVLAIIPILNQTLDEVISIVPEVNRTEDVIIEPIEELVNEISIVAPIISKPIEEKIDFKNKSAILDNISVTPEVDILNQEKTEFESTGRVVAGEPVLWTRQVRTISELDSISISIPREATVKSLMKIENGIEQKISYLKVNVNDSGSTQNIIRTDMVDIGIIPLSGFGGIINWFADLFKSSFSSVTGFVILEDNFLEENVTLIIDDLVNEVVVEYYMEGPLISEKATSEGKSVTVSSNIHYQNVLSYAQIQDVEFEGINLYWVVNGTKVQHDFAAYDTNENNLVDYIEWNTPHLSNETFEIELDIITVQSYPTVGGNWTVIFNTTGTANLSIQASNGTTWSNYQDSEDLKFLEIQCNEEIQSSIWVNNTVRINNYSCQAISKEISKVLTGGVHTIQFKFGEVIKYAFNDAANPPQVYNMVLNGTTVYNNTKENITIHYNRTDADLDDVRVIHQWYQNGNSRNILNVPFDGINNTDMTIAQDYSGHGFQGVASGATWYPDIGFDGKGAFYFDGSNDYVSFGDINQTDQPSNFTVSLWFNRTADLGLDSSHNVNNILYSASHGTSTDNIEIGTDGTTVEIWRNAQVSGRVNIEAGITNSRWYHLAVTHDSSRADSMVVYLNGQIISSFSAGRITAKTLAQNTIGLARPESLQNGDYKGVIDEFMYFNHTLSNDEITMLYRNQTNRIPYHKTITNDQWHVVSYPNDNFIDGTHNQSNIFTIRNNLPTVNSNGISTNAPNNNTFGNISTQFTFGDLDNEPVSPILNWINPQGSFAAINIPFIETNDSQRGLFYDYSGNGLHPTPSNEKFDPVGGYDGGMAAIFDGKSTFATFADSALINLGDKYTRTIEFRFKAPNVNTRQTIFNEGSSNGFSLYLDGGKLYGGVWSSTLTGYASADVEANRWYHATLVLDNSTDEVTPKKLSLYLNGILQETTSGVRVVSHNDNALFGYSDGTLRYHDGTSALANYYNGTLDEFKLYNWALDSNQILLHYNNLSERISMGRAGETWTQTIYPNDKSTSGVSVASNSLSVLTDPPILTSTVINSTNGNNGTSNNVTVYQNSTGGDFSYKHVYSWRRNGSILQSINLPFESLNDTKWNNWQDFSGSNNHCIDDGNDIRWIADGGHDGNGSIEIQGISGYLDCGDPINLKGNEFTITSWIKTGDNQNQTLAKIGSENAGIWIGIYNRLLTFAYDNSADSNIYIANYSIPADNLWHHVAGAVNSSGNLKLYFDGELVNDSTVTTLLGINPTLNLLIGSTNGINAIDGVSDWHWNGSIDDFILWNRSLSVQQIHAVSQNRMNTIVANETQVNEEWDARVYAFDGTDVSQASNTEAITIQVDSAGGGGSVGLSITDSSIFFGSGYYDPACTTGYGLINSNGSKTCWTNTTVYPTNDVHILENTGTISGNVTVTIQSVNDAEEVFCGTAQGCSSNHALINIKAENDEASSCNAVLNNVMTKIADNATKYTAPLCESLSSLAASNSIKTWIEAQAPSDMKAGSRNFIVVYEILGE